MHELGRLFEGIARGIFPDAGGVVEFVDQPGPRDCGVVAFTGHSVVFAGVRAFLAAGFLPVGAEALLTHQAATGTSPGAPDHRADGLAGGALQA